MLRRPSVIFIISTILLVLTFAGCLLVGSVDIPVSQVIDALLGNPVERSSWDYIVNETRLPAACTAMLCGASLAIGGLLMQTTFDNPLAGPSILGISTGSSLGVAIVILAFGGLVGLWGQMAIFAGALLGALTVMLLLLLMSSLVRSSAMLLIVGILLGYLTSSAISLLNFFATHESSHSFVIWGMGSFNGVTMSTLPFFAVVALLLILISMLYAKPLNALLLGSRYAASVGVNLRSVRRAMLLLSGGLTAIATAWCGPIGFIGLVVPHIARITLRTSNHHILLPATALIGALVGVFCLFISVLPGSKGVIPINAITPIIGVPIIIYIIVRRRSISYFN